MDQTKSKVVTESSKDVHSEFNDRWAKFKSVFTKGALFTVKLSVKLAILFVLISFVYQIVPDIRNMLGIKLNEKWPAAFNPVARFVANVDWKTNSVEFDASMSKAYKENIDKFIWRIDDGTGLVGSEKLQHQFQNPGYYYIQLSIVDKNGQSDSAGCQILIPPVSAKEITSKEISTELNQVTSEKYWVPEGTFFNYSKLLSTSYADLMSNRVDSNCGLSDSGYNIDSAYSNETYRNSLIRSSIVSMTENVLESAVYLGVLIVIGVILKKQKVG